MWGIYIVTNSNTLRKDKIDLGEVLFTINYVTTLLFIFVFCLGHLTSLLQTLALVLNSNQALEQKSQR